MKTKDRSSQLDVVRVRVAGRTSQAAGHRRHLGITNQRETTILWECAMGRPGRQRHRLPKLHFGRSCDRLKACGLTETFRQKPEWVPYAYFSGSKIKYLLDTIPGLRAGA